MLLPVLGRDDTRAPRADQHHRPGLGRQRGVADHRRRRHVRRLPRVVRHPVLRLLPAAAADPARADRARRRLRVPRQAPRARLEAPAGTWRIFVGSLVPAVAVGRRVRQHRARRAAGRRPRVRRRPARPAQPVRPARRPDHAGACSSPTARCSWRSRPPARSATGPTALAGRAGLVAAVLAVAFLALDAGRHPAHRRPPSVLARASRPSALVGGLAGQPGAAGRAGRSPAPPRRSRWPWRRCSPRSTRTCCPRRSTRPAA